MIDAELNKLIEVLNVPVEKDEEGREYWNTTEGRIYQRHELRKVIREVLGLDKQCFQCQGYFYEWQLSQVEGTPDLVCQDCAEGIISGAVKLREDIE